MSKFSVNWVQHAVGHGGFHTASFSFNNEILFTWIFDCGSHQKSKFLKLLTSWTNQHQRPIDWLFVSHFDFDHVNGLDMLMSRSQIKDVMIPFVNEDELAFILLHEIRRGNLERLFVELIADPAAFFLSRGADRITFLGGPPSPDSAFEPETPPPEFPDRPKWKTRINPARRQSPLKRRRSFYDISKVLVIDNPGCEIISSQWPFGLRLKPYRVPIDHLAHIDLIKDICGVTGTRFNNKLTCGLGSLAYDIARHARTSKGRAQLLAIYKLHIASSNRSSMSLLSIPFVDDDSPTYWIVAWPLLFSQSGEAGWLNTGDAELIKACDLEGWKTNYSSELKTVRVLALPHHGSDKNSDAELQNLCKHAVLSAHVKSGSQKHPGQNIVQCAGARLARVSEHPGTEVRMWFDVG